jgi:hypothetical protein
MQGLSYCGDIDLEAAERVINWEGKEYTFAWLALQKNT